MISRRNFIKGMSATVAAGLILPPKLFAMPPTKFIGIQLYTLQKQVRENFMNTLKAIADIGYNSIEAAGYADGKFYGYTPREYMK
ncbi:MAG: twin-arginine translocation signal domain-containing protein, partial [Bacteroidota bacterium]|nr:twin-arginine translocation signal domain-containing protein [Bacteroidota bacterium]